MTTDKTITSLTGLEYVANSAIKDKLAAMSDEELLFASRHVQHMGGGRSWQIIIAFAVEIRNRYATKIGWSDAPDNTGFKVTEEKVLGK